MPTPFPPGPPTIAGQAITVNAFLQNPARVERAVTNLTLNRFIADNIYAAGPQATGGAVLFDQLTAGMFFTDRDVQAIEPGGQFPIVNSGEFMPLVAAVTKWGGMVKLTYEAVRRDRRDLLARELLRLKNTIVRKVDTVAIAALQAAVNANTVPTLAVTDDWSDPTVPIGDDLETARSMIDQSDLGYEVDTLIINPAEALKLRKNHDIRSALPRESMTQNLIGAKDLSGLYRYSNVFISNRVTAGTAWAVQAKTVGGISDELPLYTRVVDQQLEECYYIMAARVTTPYVTDPKAAVKLTGL